MLNEFMLTSYSNQDVVLATHPERLSRDDLLSAVKVLMEEVRDLEQENEDLRDEHNVEVAELEAATKVCRDKADLYATQLEELADKLREIDDE